METAGSDISEVAVFFCDMDGDKNLVCCSANG